MSGSPPRQQKSATVANPDLVSPDGLPESTKLAARALLYLAGVERKKLLSTQEEGSHCLILSHTCADCSQNLGSSTMIVEMGHRFDRI